LVVAVEISKRVFLEFEKEVEVHFFMMTIFLSSIGMKHHKHWELIGWFLLLAQPCSFRLNRLVIDAGTCVTFDFIDESKIPWAQSPRVVRYKSLHDFTAKLPLLSLEV
jgi:type III pantothenate kinase